MSKPSLIPAPLASIVTSAKSRFGGLSRPAKVFAVASTVLAVLFGAIIVFQTVHEPYAVLFSQLEPDDASGIVTKLKEAKTPYRLVAGGTTIEVPESRVTDLRMELVGAGLPRGGGVGFESFDKLRLGATEFEQRVLYRRALEGELSRTIGSLGAVQTVRVHLVLPEKSVFVTRTEPASASIMLRLRSGRGLGPAEVRGIINLTAAAVPGLTEDHVAVVTTDGQMLKKPRRAGAGEDAAAGDDDEAGAQRALEAQLEDRARSMLEKVVGPGHVDVRVTADVDPARVEHVEDHYDPAKTALRSEELTRERLGAGYDDTVAGVPGAESNAPSGPLALPTAAALPPPPPAAPSSAPAASGSASAAPAARPSLIASATPRGPEQPFRESHTRNFEVDHVSDKRSIRAGSLRRVGVAVILDGIVHAEGGKKTVVPRERAELDRLTALVRSAVGASAERGDSVTVESVPFEESAAVEAEVPVAPSPFAALPRPVRTWAPVAGGALLLVLLVGGVMLTRKRRGSLVREILPAVVAQALDLPRVETKQIETDLRTRALERAAQDPATAALVLRYWLGTSASESKGASSG